MHPHLSSLHELYLAETQPFRKVHRMIDLFESIIKTHTVVILSEYVRHNKLSDTAKGLLSQGLRTPSLGTWQLFSRVLFEELQKENFEWSLSDFAAEFIELDKALNADKTNVIVFRNGYAHGATPSDSSCEADIKKFEPFLHKLLQSKWLSASSLEEIDGKVFLRCKGSAEAGGEEVRSLHPILLYRNENSGASFAFFNDIKNDKIGLLNYPLGKHYREKDFFREFHEYLPLHEWKKSGNNEFYQRIEELTETFKGRTQERASLVQFVSEKSKGYCSIQGNPGIGKSALIAQFFKDLKAHKELKQLPVIEYFIRRGTQQAQAEYLFNYIIKRTDEVFPQGKEIRAEGKMVFDLQNQLFSKWRMWNEHCQGKKLLFLIDGLDEGTENNVVTYLPRENFENILFIYGSRPGGHKSIDDLWGTLLVEHHTKLELTGLGKEDIRALIYEVANKYEVERESTWIDAVQQRSQGNPLYLKLLCDALENGSIALNDIGALPKEIDEYYRAILQRYAADLTDGDALLAGLYTFAAAKDYLTMAHLGLINKLGEATVQRIGSTLKEVLYENPLTEAVLDYQLFHESFREYLVKEKALKVQEAGERILDFCASWRELEGSWEQRYALEHYAAHLAESKRHERAGELIKLLYDKPYASAQKKVLKNFNATAVLYRQSLLKASEQQLWDDQLEAALNLVDLHYEEANDAPQVVAMVANGEIDLALKRIDSFGGADKEDIQRKFILYMLCLMELTLLDSKDKPFQKMAVDRLLDHLDENLPTDNSVLNWGEFFPGFLMFQLSFELDSLGLDYGVLFSRTSTWEINWVKKVHTFDPRQVKFLNEYASEITDDTARSTFLSWISYKFAKQGYIEQSLSFSRDVMDYSDKGFSIAAISTALFNNGDLEEANKLCQQAISLVRSGMYLSKKIDRLSSIIKELEAQERKEDAILLIDELINAIIESDDESIIEDYSIELARGKTINKAMNLASKLGVNRIKSIMLAALSTNLSSKGRFEEAAETMNESIAVARLLSDNSAIRQALAFISTELWNQGNFQYSETIMLEACSLKDGEPNVLNVLSPEYLNAAVACEYAKRGRSAEAIEIVLALPRGFMRDCYLMALIHELIKGELTSHATECVYELQNVGFRYSAFSDLVNQLLIQGRVTDSYALIEGLTALNRFRYEEYKELKIIEDVSFRLIGESKYDASFACLQNMHGFMANIFKTVVATALVKSCSSAEILKWGRELEQSLDVDDKFQIAYSAALARNSHKYDALLYARSINENYTKCHAIMGIASVLFGQGDIIGSEQLFEEALNCIRAISDTDFKSQLLINYAVERANLGKLEHVESLLQEALICARDVQFLPRRCALLRDLSLELFNYGKAEESNRVLQDAISCAMEMDDASSKGWALLEIVLKTRIQDKLNEALEIARLISVENWKSRGLIYIYIELDKLGMFNEAKSVLNEALQSAYSIKDFYTGVEALKEITGALVKQGNCEHAEKILLEVEQMGTRHLCLKNMADVAFEFNGWQGSLEMSKNLVAEESSLFYLTGWAEKQLVSEMEDKCVRQALPLIVGDAQTIECVLLLNALNKVFFGDLSKERLNRLNRTLNIQWALDIAAQFPKEESSARLSTNLDTWLHKIKDEDDREQIELWAKQVAKGKITEEEFGGRVNGL